MKGGVLFRCIMVTSSFVVQLSSLMLWVVEGGEEGDKSLQ